MSYTRNIQTNIDQQDFLLIFITLLLTYLEPPRSLICSPQFTFFIYGRNYLTYAYLGQSCLSLIITVLLLFSHQGAYCVDSFFFEVLACGNSFLFARPSYYQFIFSPTHQYTDCSISTCYLVCSIFGLSKASYFFLFSTWTFFQ